MALFSKTEIDVLRESVRKAVLTAVEDPFEALDNVPVSEPAGSRPAQFKLALRIWTAAGKYIRSQCNKGRVIDTCAFGTFAKASAIGVKTADADSYYVYCAGPNSAFTSQENL
jgi:hypothetical protein